MKKEKREKDFRKKPIYPGGNSALKQFIKDHLQYPEEALKNKVEGGVIVQFTIDHLGKVTHTKVISGLGYGCDEEAQRVIQLLTFEVPKNRGFKKSTQTLGVHFKMKEIPRSTPTTTSFEYQITKSPAKEEKKEESSGDSSSYHYTIEW